MQHSKTVVIIAGPTAVGKTALAIAVAQHFHTQIISADSRQCYKELTIGVARPTLQELQQVPHHFIASHSIQTNVTAAVFEAYALSVVEQLFKQNNIVVMVGGTGLYINAFCNGLDEMPEVPEHIRQQIIHQYNTKGLGWLQQQVQQKDPAFWAVAEQQNPHRLIRCLEIVEVTGKSITYFRKGNEKNRPFNIIQIGLELPRAELYNKINNRVDIMLQQGLVDEVNSLMPHQQLNALQTVGYKELFAYLHQTISFKDAVEAIKKHTRHYAKRQLTWFKKQEQIQWFLPSEHQQIITHINNQLLNT